MSCLGLRLKAYLALYCTRNMIREIGFSGLLTIGCKQLNMSLCMWLIKNINVAYYHLQIEGGADILITCTHVEQVFGIPPGGRKSVLDTHRYCDVRVPSIQKIERLMLETKNAEEFHQLFIIFTCAIVLAPTMHLEVHHALWHIPLIEIIGDIN